ncbi:MAG TPA: cardiolipin synthase [Planctomycetaceae bacterium]|nr:cardiolipin synthase [Planctomycetaceae bacterium]
MSWLTWEQETWALFVATLSLLDAVMLVALVPVVLLMKKPSSSSTVAWLMLIVAVPLVGGGLFLLFGIDRVQPRVRRRRAVTERFAPSLPQLAAHLVHTHERLNETQMQLLRLAQKVAGTKATVGNRVELFQNTHAAMNSIIRAVEAAEQSIHLEYYIWQPDRIGTKLRDLLIEKARAGVKVRFLYDALGSLRLGQSFFRPMLDAGIEVASFVPGQTFRERWSINLRSHRKIVLVDGVTGFTGGMNIGDEYLGRSKHFGFWRDAHLRLDGPTVLQLQEVFAVDWLYATGEDLNGPELFPPPRDAGTVDAQVVAGGPDLPESVFHTLMFAGINEARHSATLATSYFVPTPAFSSALCAAALRGVRTRVLVSGPVTYWMTYHAGRSFYDELLAAGVEVYEYTRGQQHSKTLTIDRCWSLVGTPNFDPRSVYLNFEVGVVLYDENIADQLDHQFDTDLKDASRIERDEWAKRSIGRKLIENGCRMFAPVL